MRNWKVDTKTDVTEKETIIMDYSDHMLTNWKIYKKLISFIWNLQKLKHHVIEINHE
jgi:hypothetical protein